MAQMKTFQLEVRAENKEESQAAIMAWIKDGALFYHLEEKEEPADWIKEVDEYAEAIINDHDTEWDKDIKELYEGGKKDVDDIYDWLYQKHDLVGVCHEYIDNRFIYTDSKSIISYMECINELYRFEETDSGLWGGDTTVEQIVAAKAFYTMRNALITKVEEKLKARIMDFIEEHYGEPD